MIKKIFKIKDKLIKLLDQKKNQKKITQRVKSNSELRKNEKSDLDRWSKTEELFNDWDERTYILANYLDQNSDIIEFGAGNMRIKNSNVKYNTYTPSDIVKRHEDTIVCDLNKPLEIDLSKYNAVLLSGVLEYVYDVESVIHQFSLNGVKQIAISYCCSDIVLLSRDKNGWLSDFKKNEIEEIFTKNNYSIQNYSEWRNQSLYFLRLNN